MALRPGVEGKVFPRESEFKERFVKVDSFNEILYDFIYLRDLNTASSGGMLALFRTVSFISDYKVPQSTTSASGSGGILKVPSFPPASTSSA